MRKAAAAAAAASGSPGFEQKKRKRKRQKRKRRTFPPNPDPCPAWDISGPAPRPPEIPPSALFRHRPRHRGRPAIRPARAETAAMKFGRGTRVGAGRRRAKLSKAKMPHFNAERSLSGAGDRRRERPSDERRGRQ